jgi:hypothetical protein
MTVEVGLEIIATAEAQHPENLTPEQRAHLGLSDDVATEGK